MMVGDTSDYVKLVALVKKKVGAICGRSAFHPPEFGSHRNPLTSHPRNLCSARAAVPKIQATISTKTPRSAAVT